MKIIDVYCKNGHLIFEKYLKEKPGFLMKCYINKIGIDHIGVSGMKNSQDVFCPQCKLRVGRIGLVHGRPAVVINHGTVKRIKT
jgi:hypothetical protein